MQLCRQGLVSHLNGEPDAFCGETQFRCRKGVLRFPNSKHWAVSPMTDHCAGLEVDNLVELAQQGDTDSWFENRAIISSRARWRLLSSSRSCHALSYSLSWSYQHCNVQQRDARLLTRNNGGLPVQSWWLWSPSAWTQCVAKGSLLWRRDLHLEKRIDKQKQNRIDKQKQNRIDKQKQNRGFFYIDFLPC